MGRSGNGHTSGLPSCPRWTADELERVRSRTDSSRAKGNFQVRFLGGRERTIAPTYQAKGSARQKAISSERCDGPTFNIILSPCMPGSSSAGEVGLRCGTRAAGSLN